VDYLKSNQTLLVIGKVWPEPNSSAAGTRILQIIHIFQKQNFEIVFCSAAKKSEFSVDLGSKNITTKPIKLNNSSFDDFLSNLKPDVVLFDRFMTEEQFGWRVAEKVPEAIRILDTEDLHFLRRARELSLKKGAINGSDFYSHLNNDVMVRELASILRCDVTIMISEFEIEILMEEFKIARRKLLHLPLMVKNEDMMDADILPTFNQRHNFVSIGNFLHPPNLDSVRYLKEQIWPKIRKSIPDSECHIYGAYPDLKVLNLDSPDIGFLIKGRANDVSETLSIYKVMLAPLRFGAGQKGKLLDAMIAGLPSVTTKIGAEGMCSKKEWPGYICDDRDAFADQAIRLYSDHYVWLKMQSNIKPVLDTNFNLEKFTKQFLNDLTDFMATMNRSTDYFGAVLNYQTHHAAKYLGKWIEEKNNGNSHHE